MSLREVRWILPQVLLLWIAMLGEALAVPPINAGAEDHIAIHGYDPVAYFEAGAPTLGEPAHTAEWMGATWQFASAENRDRFSADPTKYAPQYGGWCAYAVANNRTADIDPSAWKIVEGKLYLNYSPSIKAKWEQDIPGFITKAEQNWPALKDAE